MKRVSKIFLVIAILASFSIPTVSQDNQPAESKETKASNDYAMGYGHGNRRSFSDQLIPNSKTENQKQAGEQIKFGEVIGLIIAGLVAIFNYLLWRTTKDLWTVTREQADATQSSAEAALKSAETAERLVDLERPFIGLKIIDPGVERLDPKDMGIIGFTANGVSFCFENFGRTPATLTELYALPVIAPAGKMPPCLTQAEGGKAYPFGVFAGPRGQSPTSKRRFEKYIPNNADWNAFTHGDAELFLIGRLKYHDIFGNTYVLGFCSRFAKRAYGKGQFMIVGDKNYNYSRKTKEQTS